MFFPERIKNIKTGDRVLEIGPGSHPYHRSDVLLELSYEKEEDRRAQFGHGESLQTSKQVVYYDGVAFPFEDKAFDYVICSHVLEHVGDVEAFLAEIFRVSGKGYMEYPLAYYDYLYNFEVHLNLLKFDGRALHYMKKKETSMNEFKAIQDFFRETLNQGHATLVEKLLPQFMEGFEWTQSFAVQKTGNLNDLLHKQSVVPKYMAPEPVYGIGHHVKAIVRKLVFFNRKKE